MGVSFRKLKRLLWLLNLMLSVLTVSSYSGKLPSSLYVLLYLVITSHCELYIPLDYLSHRSCSLRLAIAPMCSLMLVSRTDERRQFGEQIHPLDQLRKGRSPSSVVALFVHVEQIAKSTPLIASSWCICQVAAEPTTLQPVAARCLRVSMLRTQQYIHKRQACFTISSQITSELAKCYGVFECPFKLILMKICWYLHMKAILPDQHKVQKPTA